MRLLRASHFGPTIVVSAISYLLAETLWPIRQSALIAFTIFLGQLCVGWSNDLVDIDIDRQEGRKNKPLAEGLIRPSTVTRAIFIDLTFCIPLSLFGPLGIRGGLVHLLGVGCGVSYNFYFKRTLLSPIPYVVAFAGLPTSIALSKGHFAPATIVVIGSVFGVAAHFANVLKDIDKDLEAGIIGLPQRLGSEVSRVIAGSALVFITLVLTSYSGQPWLVPIALSALIAIIRLPLKYAFVIIMALAVVDVLILISAGASILVQRS